MSVESTVGNQDSLSGGCKPPAGLTVTLEAAAVDVDTSSGEIRRILHPLWLTLTDRVTAVIGANGSGKSTLLRLIAGLAAPTAGSVTFARDGRPAARPQSGFIFANPEAQIIMPVVIEDIEFSLRRTVKNRAQRRRRSREVLEALQLGHRENASVYELSSGERQKVALAGVLAAYPELVIADEPTTLLDLRNAAEFRTRLLNLGVPLMLATHDLDFAAAADRVLVFDAGRVVFDGAPTEAIGHYRALATPDSGDLR